MSGLTLQQITLLTNSFRNLMSQHAFLEQLKELDSRTVRIALFPARWRWFCARYQPDWNYTPFETDKVAQISDSPGVYCFHVGHRLTCLPPFGISLYGGITKVSLRRRCMGYFSEKDSPSGRISVRKFLHVFEGELTLFWSEIDITSFDIDQLERDFNDAMMPPYSRRDFSAEVRSARSAWQ